VAVPDAPSLSADRIKHLEFIQATIARFGNTSFIIKGWAFTVSAAIFAIQANKLTLGLAATTFVPVFAFWALDGYFLWQERLFRFLYDDVRQPISPVESMSMNTAGYRPRTSWWAATRSTTLLLAYGGLTVIDVFLLVTAILK